MRGFHHFEEGGKAWEVFPFEKEKWNQTKKALSGENGWESSKKEKAISHQETTHLSLNLVLRSSKNNQKRLVLAAKGTIFFNLGW